MPSTKGWTVIITAVGGILVVLVYVVLKVTITVVVFQRIDKGFGRVLVTSII